MQIYQLGSEKNKSWAKPDLIKTCQTLWKWKTCRGRVCQVSIYLNCPEISSLDSYSLQTDIIFYEIRLLLFLYPVHSRLNVEFCWKPVDYSYIQVQTVTIYPTKSCVFNNLRIKQNLLCAYRKFDFQTIILKSKLWQVTHIYHIHYGDQKIRVTLFELNVEKYV